MPALKHPCGCVFDAEFVDATHSETEPHHRLVSAKKVAPAVDEDEFGPHESKGSLLVKVGKVLSGKKGK